MRILAALAVLCLSAWAAPTLIIDTIEVGIGGGTFSGAMVIESPDMTTADGRTIARWSQSFTVVNGVIQGPTIRLEPNDAALPAGTSYRVLYTPKAGRGWEERWVVPTSATPVEINQVRVAVTPSPTTLVNIAQLRFTGVGYMPYAGAGGIGAQRAPGTVGQCWVMGATTPDWGTCAAGGVGLSSLNGLTGATQTFATGTTGADFGISSSGTTHTWNLPSASASNRGALTSADWTTFNNKLLSPLTTRGDLLTRDGSAHARLAIGASTRVLKSNGTDPSWGQVDYFELTSTPSTFIPSVHDHEDGSQGGQLDAGLAFNAGVLPSARGGTGSGFTKFDGPETTEKLFMLPNAPATILTDNAPVTFAQGGTGLNAAADDTTIVSSGSAWVARALPNCVDSGGNHLNYTVATNTFSCGTTGGGGAGEANTASNTGSVGIGVFKQKVSVDLEFYKLNSVDNKLTIALDGTDKIDLTVNQGNLTLSSIGGAVTDGQVPDTITVDQATVALTANAGDSATGFFSSGAVEEARIHADIARDAEVAATYVSLTRTITTGAGLSGGGDLSANRTLIWDPATYVSNVSLWDGSQASRTLAASLSGATDPVITFSNDTINVSTGAFQVGGTAVSLAGHAHAGEDVTSGTVADARIASTLARDSEVAAAYQPLDAALTEISAGSDFVQFTGPATSTKVFTLPNATAAILTDNAAVTVAQGGSGAATLTGLLQGNGTSPFTAISNSSTVGQLLRVTGASAYGWGALDLADTDAVTGLLPDGNIAAALMRDSELATFAVTKTEMTYDAEASGNVLTTVGTTYLEAGGCQGATAGLMWDHQATGMPAAACVGTNQVKAPADFDAAADEAMHRYFALPADFTGTLDARVFWFAAATTGTARFGIRIDCFAVGEDVDGAVTNSTTFAATPNGTTNRLAVTSQTGITITGCAAGELARVNFFRDGDGTSGTDDMTGDARVLGIELKTRRAQ